jgi:hypothetical protein
MQTSVPGEDAMAILARAQLYEEFALVGTLAGLGGARADKCGVDAP